MGALALQWATPVLAFRSAPVLQTEIPSILLNVLRLVPVRLVTSQGFLYLASSDPVDYRVLQAIEEMTSWRTRACVVSDRVMNDLLCQTTSMSKGDTPLFLKVTGSAEVSRIIASYADRLGAEGVKLTSCGPYLWVRLNSSRRRSDLLFRRPLHSQREMVYGQGDEREELQAFVAV